MTHTHTTHTHKTRNITAITKRVAEVNEMINQANELGISVVDETCTWQAPLKYSPIVYSNGIMYVNYTELDLFAYSRGKGKIWMPKKDKVNKHDDWVMGGEGFAQKQYLTEIARMYRKQLRHYKTYGYTL